MMHKRSLKLNLILESNFPCNTTDIRGRGGAAAARAATSHTGAGILASLSCTSSREDFIDSYLSSDTLPSSEKSSNVLISSW